MHEGDSSLIHFNEDTGMRAILAITIEARRHNIKHKLHPL